MQILKLLNTVLSVAVAAVLFGCGGDPMDAPKGSTEERMCGDWVSDVLPAVEGDNTGGERVMELDVSFWNFGLLLTPQEVSVPKGGGTPIRSGSMQSISDFKVSGLTAISDPERSRDRSTWTLRVDPDSPDTLYVTWVKDGIKRFNEVKFHTKK